MNKLIRTLEKKQMLVTMLSAFVLLLLLTFAINIVFYYQEAKNNEREQRVFLIDSLQTKLKSYGNSMYNIRYDTDVLFSMPGLDEFIDSGVVSEDDYSYFKTYAQSRYAFNGIAYYQENTRTLVGFMDEEIQCAGRDAILDMLALSPVAWDTLLAEDGFVFTNETEQKVIVSNRIADHVVCLRIIPHATTMNYLQFVSGNNQSSMFPSWSLTVEDKIGQTLSLGQALPDNCVYASEYYMSGSTDFHITLQIADQAFTVVWQFISKTLLYYGSALLILGSMLIYLFVSQMYKPIKNVLDVLPEELSIDTERSEHNRIQEAIRLLCEKQASNEDLLNTQHALLRQNFLQRLIISNLVELDGVDSLLERYHLTSCFEQYAVLMLVPADSGCSLIDMDVGIVADPQFQIDSIIRKHDSMLLLISSTQDGADFHALATKMLTAFEETYDIRLQLYQSAIHDDITEANAAYLECSIAMEKHICAPEEAGVFSYGELSRTGTKDAKSNPLIALEQQLYQAVLTRQASEAQNLFSQYCTRLAKTTFSFRLQRVQMVALYMHLFSIPGMQRDDPESIKETDLIALLSSQLSKDEFWNRVQALSDHLLPQALPQAECRSERFDSLLSYVQAHLCEETLCAAEVAEAFSISASSLTREFQKNLGIGFSNYVHIQRVNMAKALLQQSAKPIKDIAAEVGYSNTLTLTRAFRKYEGTTPGAYRTTQVSI